MAGKPGMKGGGGKRAGAGRKKADPVLLATEPSLTTPNADNLEPDSIRVLRQITNDLSLDVKVRLDAAKALAPYEAQRIGDGGKKEERQGAAKKAAHGKFGAGSPPLKLVNSL